MESLQNHPHLPHLPDIPGVDKVGDKTKLWVFWSTLSAISLFNISLYCYICVKEKRRFSSDKRTAAYQKWSLVLAAPFVFECAWRSVFPSIYTPRTVFWDTPLNSIMVDRTLACIGEVTWSIQYSLVVRRLNEDVSRVSNEAPSIFVTFVTYVLPFLAVCGEIFSYTCVATTNNIYCTVENSFWTAQFILLIPSCAYLFSQLRKEIFTDRDVFHPRFFTGTAVVCGIFYVPYMVMFNLPMYLDRWHSDNKNGVTYFGFFEGLKDATVHWNQSWHWEDWKNDWFWMVWYFTFITWTSLYMMKAPRIEEKGDLPQADSELEAPLVDQE
mmetsp:Transcript_8019/g.9197  ORF Transcript_8019/g.9197 Transcript_8019/m.9197 type:complete len:326 (+) Transcript_8019:89-1066(+)